MTKIQEIRTIETLKRRTPTPLPAAAAPTPPTMLVPTKPVQILPITPNIPILPIEKTLSPPPVQLAPADGTTFSNSPRTTTLSWRSLRGTFKYTVEIDCFNCCQLGTWCTDLGKTWKVAPNLSGTNYTFDFAGPQPGRWRVWGVDDTGKEPAKSGWWEFTYIR